jgi:protein-disulfide isomerase
MKKQAAMIAICAALLLCVAAAGCTSSTSSSPNASAAANSSSQPAAGSPTATAMPTATATPPATPTASPSGGATSLTVLFFYDPSCPHCQAIEGQVQNIPTYGGKVSVQWVDTTTTAGYNELGSYGSTTVPVFVILNGGSEVWSQVSPTSTDQLNAQISSLLT